MTTKTNELAGLKIVEAFKTCKKGGREFDYFEQGYRAACTDFAQPAPVQEPVEQERESLRAAQSEAVMPLIGPLLDAWEGGSDFLNEYPELDKQLRHINRAMENAAPPAAQPAPVADTEIKDAYIASHGTDDGWLGIEGSYYISGYQSGRKANPPAAQPAPTQEHQINQLEKFKNHVLANANALGVVLDAPAAPVQEPVATVQSLHVDGKDIGVQAHLHQHLPVGTKLYAAPPAAPAQEPIGYWPVERAGEYHSHDSVTAYRTPKAGWMAVYTTPPAAQRQWVGLTTDDVWGSNEVMALNAEMGLTIVQIMTLMAWANAKLKEKNT